MDATLGILLTMRENVSSQTSRVKSEIGGLTESMASNRIAVRQLASCVTYLGATFMSMGVAMQNSNNQFLQSNSSTMIFIGGLLTAVGSAAQFISAISRIIDSLRKLAAAQILVKALSGPAGWATLAAGVAVAGVTIAGVSKMTSGTPATSKTDKPVSTINITQNIAGSVTTERDLTNNLHRGLLLKEQRSNKTGIQ
jgi:hypothetical protein